MQKTCFHCGQNIDAELIIFDEKEFCCTGCKSVFQILNSHHLEKFYELNKKSGVRPAAKDPSDFQYLDTPEIFNAIIEFSDDDLGTSSVSFKIPVIHCTSCIWLLESLKNIHSSILYSQVNFTRKNVSITFRHKELPLSELALLLTNLGYKPVINLETSEKKDVRVDRSLLMKLAIAGFAFGNGMFFSFPEYFGGDDIWLEKYKWVFRGLMLLLSLPVVIYSASGYYTSAWYGLKNKIINIDVPIVIGILVLFSRSLYEIVTDYGAGYFDTLCGLLFFMLLGKVFQQRTYSALSYDRDYKSFYPIAVTKIISAEVQENIMLKDLQIGDRILIRNQEIIPADCVLIHGDARIDNSFITGESRAISKKAGDRIFAGGKQTGGLLELEIIKPIDQSYLTRLWNKDIFKKEETGLDSITNTISKYFTLSILAIALIAGIYWYGISQEKMFQVVSAILIVACPCALALSAPFTMGHIMRILGKQKFYVKDTLVVERLAKADVILFDKTGTLTEAASASIMYDGKDILNFDIQNIKSLLQHSNHPLSRSLYQYISIDNGFYPVENFEEVSGKGFSATLRGVRYAIGSYSYVASGARLNEQLSLNETAVYISKEGDVLGKYVFRSKFRNGMEEISSHLTSYEIHILSGDTEGDQEVLQKLFPSATLSFRKSPEDKLSYVKNLQEKGKNCIMIGDGLNDAGALKQSNVGIAVADDTHTFTPASDIIMAGESLGILPKILGLSKKSIKIVKTTFVISLLYNVVGLAVAISGNMDPLFAAIIMPVSSISVVAFTSLSTHYYGRKIFRDTI